MRGFVVCLALIAALQVAGCGGNSSSSATSDFKSSFPSVANGFKNTSHAIGVAIQQAPSKTAAELAATFNALAARWRAQLARLQALNPPSAVSDAFSSLKSAAARARPDLKAVASAAGADNASAAKQATISLINDVLAAKSASTTITNKLGISAG